MSPVIQLWIGLGCCALYTLTAFIFYRFPPREINLFYGYRTKRSMANAEVWKMANDYSAKKMLQLTLAGFLVPVVLYFLIPEHNFLISIIVTTLMLLSVMWFTEKHLDKHFDKKGNPLR